jgi:hypothetical protein
MRESEIKARPHDISTKTQRFRAVTYSRLAVNPLLPVPELPNLSFRVTLAVRTPPLHLKSWSTSLRAGLG